MRILISYSSNPHVDGLISLLSIIILELNGNPIKAVAPKLRAWTADATALFKKWGIYKDANKYLNKFLLSKTLTDTEAVELGTLLKSAREHMVRDTTISKPKLDLLLSCVQNLHNDSESAWNRIIKNIKILEDPVLCQLYNDDAEIEIDGMNYKEASKKLVPVAKALLGTSSRLFLSIEEMRTLSASKPKQYQQYKDLLKVITRTVKHEIRKFVRQKNVKLVSIEEIKAHFQKIGLPNNLPIGFVGGQMDEDGRAYTAEGKLLDKIPYGKVLMNPKYDPSTDSTYVMSGIDHPVRYRTVTFLTGKKKERHSLVQEFINNESDYRSRWLTDLNKSNSEDQIVAAMVEIMYATSARVGERGNQSAGEPTYGLTTLLVEHVRVTPKSIIFDYKGKKLASQSAVYKGLTVESKKVISIVKDCLAGKSNTDHVFTFRKHRITRQIVASYLKEKGIPLTPHGFRRITGTKLAMQLIKKAPFKAADNPKQAEVERWFKNEALHIGEVLHHRSGEKITSSTAIKSYIDPEVMSNFFEGLGLRVPSWVPKT